MSSEHDTPPPTWPKWAALGGLCVTCALIGLLVHDATQAPAPTTQQVYDDAYAFELGEPGIYYIWITSDQETKSTKSPEEVPSWARIATQVWRPEWGPRHDDAGRVYIANLYDTSPGDKLIARRQSRAWMWQASRAADAAETHALLTEFLAREWAAEHPSSERSRSVSTTMNLLKELEERRPMTHEELLERMHAQHRRARVRREARRRYMMKNRAKQSGE